MRSTQSEYADFGFGPEKRARQAFLWDSVTVAVSLRTGQPAKKASLGWESVVGWERVEDRIKRRRTFDRAAYRRIFRAERLAVRALGQKLATGNLEAPVFGFGMFVTNVNDVSKEST